MKKSLLYLFILLTFGLILVGCQDKEADSETKESVDMNEEGLPIVDEKVTLNFVSPKAPLAPDYNEMEIVQQLEEDTNVHIEWDNIPGEGYQEKKNLMLASGDLPDAFYDAQFTDHDIVTYGQNGTLIPLEDLIKEHAPNLQKVLEKRPGIKSMITAPDGHIYTLPRAEEMGLVRTPNFASINKTWLDNLGLEMPTTLEEYHDVLVAFKNEDPNGNGKQDEIPLSFMYEFWTGNFSNFFSNFGVPDQPDDHRYVEDGKVKYAPAQEGWKEAISYFHGWVEEGLIDEESFTQDSKAYFAKGKTEDETLGSYIWWETEEVVGPERADDYAILPVLENLDGEKFIGPSNLSEYGRAAFAITKANPHPEVTMRWVDQLYEPYMSAQVSWGPIGTIYEKDENGMLVNKELPEDVAMGELRQKVAPGGPIVVLEEDFGTVVDMEPRAKQRLKDIQDYYEPYLGEEKYPQIFFSPEELEQINQIEVNIKEFVKQKKAQWLLNGGIEEEWDEYKATLEQMGLPKLMEIYQNGLERFNENKK
ncbi:ABC transporter substrate-binding protein [Halobacillus mangrovi]|uniref:ABC transporter substrate-binding protein n=1 Tax=Halobacillus mangrovi TaxID=402384 RepID=UPI003D966ADD